MSLLFVYHAVYATLIGYGLAYSFGQLTAAIAAIALFTALPLAWLSSRTTLRRDPSYKFDHFAEGPAGLVEVVLFLFILFASWRHFTWLLYPGEHWLRTLNVSNLGDLPLHINYIRMLANGVDFPPLNPEFAAESLRYPFACDLYNAMFEVIGVRLEFHLFAVAMLSTIASLVLLRRYAGWLGVGAFFLNGGWIAFTSLMAGSNNWDWQSQLAWKNLFLTVFVTQRGVLFALPLGLLLLMQLQDRLKLVTTAVGKAPLSITPSLRFSLLWGALAFFHAHAFVIVSLMLFAILLIEVGLRSAIGFLFSKKNFPALIIASYFVWRTTGGFAKAAVAHWRFGWTFEHGLANYVWLNFAFWSLMPLVIFYILRRAKTQLSETQVRKTVFETLTYLGLFILFFNLMMAPDAWDNIKILIWPYLALARITSLVLEPELQKLNDAWRWLLAGALFTSGALAVGYSLGPVPRRSTSVYSEGDLANAKGALSGLPVNAVFAAAPTYAHALTYFGRLRALGYEGHLWSHGISYQSQLERLNELMKTGGSELDEARWRSLVQGLGAHYIFWGPDERASYGAQLRPWMKVFKNVSRVPEVSIYQIQ